MRSVNYQRGLKTSEVILPALPLEDNVFKHFGIHQLIIREA